MYTYRTRGTCSSAIQFDIRDGNITDCRFIGGCAGNTQGVAALVRGMSVEEAISRLKGIQCRGGTSCPDQLARALEAWQKSNQN